MAGGADIQGKRNPRNNQANWGSSTLPKQFEKISKKVAALNIESLGLQIGRADVLTSELRNVLAWAEKCPLCVNAATKVGGSNLSLYLVAEDSEMFQTIVDGHIRRIHGVSLLNFHPLVRWHRPFMGNLDLQVRRSSKPPCNMFPYCPGCPKNPNYRGKLWNRAKNGRRNRKS
jgi:hypothetical protein